MKQRVFSAAGLVCSWVVMTVATAAWAIAQDSPVAEHGKSLSPIARQYAMRVLQVLTDAHPKNTSNASGQVVVAFSIGANGKQEQVSVVKSSGSRDLDRLGLATVTKAVFPVPPPELTKEQRTFRAPFNFIPAPPYPTAPAPSRGR